MGGVKVEEGIAGISGDGETIKHCSLLPTSYFIFVSSRS